jgi:broad specificity phosphatase PhoE
MRFTFVRHGQSVANVSGRWQGHGDAPLSETGRAQADKLGARLAKRFDRVVSSDLVRAMDTARTLGLPLETDPAFREIDVGRWEGLTRQEVLEQFPDEIAAIFRGEDVAIGGGESWAMATARAEAALARLRERVGRDERIAVVCHGGIISSLFLRFHGVRARRPQPVGRMVNTAVSEVFFDGDRAVVERYNDALHTAPDGAWSRAEFGPKDAIATLIAWPADRKFAFEDASLTACALAGITQVTVDGSGETLALGRAVADVANAELSEGPFDLGALPADGQRVAFVTAADNIHVLAKRIVAPYADHPHLGIPALGSLTHVAKTHSVTLLADYNVGPLVIPE